VSAIDPHARTIFIADVHRGDEKLTAFPGLESATACKISPYAKIRRCLIDQWPIDLQVTSLVNTVPQKDLNPGVRVRKPILSVFSSPLSDLQSLGQQPRERTETPTNPLIQHKLPPSCRTSRSFGTAMHLFRRIRIFLKPRKIFGRNK
jgi:hypothetical protein